VSEQPSAAATAAAVRGGSAIAVAIGVMNVSTYAFTIVAARILGPQPYGAFAAVMNVLLVAGVLNLALQATAARRIAREPGDAHLVEQQILVVGRRASIGLGVALLVLSPLVNYLLRLDSMPTALLLAVAVVPSTMMGAQAGVLQGERRWVPLALVYLAAGIPRIVLGGLFLLWRQDELAAVAAVAAAAFMPVLVAGIALGKNERELAPIISVPTDHSARSLWWETVYNSQALLAFLVLSSVDIILARRALSLHDAGLYAAGLILVKAVMFLPQFVVILAFPSMGAGLAARRALLGSLALVAASGLAVTLGVQLLPHLALTFVGGTSYNAVGGRLWIFAVLGTVLSMLQLLVYSVLAQQARTAVLWIWAGLVALLAAGLTSHTVLEMATRVLSVDAVVLLVLLLLGLRSLGVRQLAGPSDLASSPRG
jgi:O-antigen/teichoic acid export membrane protein